MQKKNLAVTFAAAGTTVMALAMGMITIGEPRGLSLASLGVAVLEIGMLTAGYAGTLWWLPRRAGALQTRKSHAVAGVFAPIALAALSTQVQGVSIAGIASLSVAIGASLGIVQWVRTLRPPRPPKPTIEEVELAADVALQQAIEAAAPRADVIPIHRPDRVQNPPAEQVA